MVALKRIGLSNFKAFKSFQQVDISPVSLLFGYNNSGKSSILRAVLLLADSFKKSEVPMYQSSILDYTSESIRGASHVELAHNNKPGMSFTLSWEDGSSVRFKVFQNGLDAEVIQEIEVQQFGCSYLFLQSLDADAPIGTYILQDSAEEVEMTVKDFRLDCEKVDFSHINQLIEAFSKSVYYLSSTRKYPPREFEIGIGVPLHIYPDGNGTAEYIWHLSETGSPSFNDINKWLSHISGRKIDTTGSFRTIGLKNGTRVVKLETVPVSSAEDAPISILDSGEGIAQVLPVITLCARAANGELGNDPVVVLEQPELHLHPDAIVYLAEFICDCAQRNKNARYIIETHSESFLISMQKALVDNRLKNNEFSCNWVCKGPSESRIAKVVFDDDGYILENWPDDVFGEVFQQTRDLIDLREKRETKSS